MATSSIGRTTVVDKEHAEALAKAIREYRAKQACRKKKVPFDAIANVHAIGHPITRR